MCTVAPLALPGVARRAAPPVLDVRATMAAADPAPRCWYGGYGDDSYEMDELLRGIDAAVRLPAPAAADVPMPPAQFLAPSRQHSYYADDAHFGALLRGIPRVRVPPPGFPPVPAAAARHDAPTTPVAVLAAPRSYGDDFATVTSSIVKTPVKKQKQEGEDYDADIDAALRAMESDPLERPSAEYLSTTQAGQMKMIDRAALVAEMHWFSTDYKLAPGALHRAVSYVDRFLSARRVHDGDQLLVLGVAAVLTAAKYEERSTAWAKADADAVAEYADCTRGEVLDAERRLVAALGYRLSGPTAYTFVDHFTRRLPEAGHGAAVRALAHHLADMALLDLRCVQFLPSAVAAAALMLAMVALGCSMPVRPVAGYTLDDLAECVDVVYDMHENLEVWPGCSQMLEEFWKRTQLSYSLPPRSLLH